MDEKWHSSNIEEVAKAFEADLVSGLSDKEVGKKREKWGKNKLPEKKEATKLKIFLMQFNSPIVYILVIASVVTGVLHELTDALVIFMAVLINAVFGFWEENKSLSILEKLKKVLKTKALVLRDGNKKSVFLEEIVPGDILILEAGEKVPADGRVIQTENLKVSEAVITGEWLPSDKSTEAISKGTHLAERENMVYAGSLVEAGSGRAIATATGAHTEIGKTAKLVSEAEETLSPLQKKLAAFGKTISYLILVSVGLIFVGGILRRGDPLEMFEAAVAISVGGIPEALPVVMTVILALGMDRLLKKKGLIRKLSSVETLGSTNVICFDKTKTLTEGKMRVSEIISDNKDLTIKAALLASEAFVDNPKEKSPTKWKLEGTPTGRAIIKEAANRGFIKHKINKIEQEILRLPFDPVKKYMISLRQKGKSKSKTLYVLGAPESILKNSENPSNWEDKAKTLMGRGYRVVGVATKNIKMKSPKLSDLKKQKNFDFIGLIALADPLRKDIQSSIKICQSAGLKPIIITGDHARTAKEVAIKSGIKLKDSEIMEGRDLDGMSDKEVENIVEKIKLYARAEPKHKIRIVKAWQKKGAVVAMAGDGVNDAPAIKQADVGLALGSGTEVAIAAADLVLLNDSFKIIVDAIEQGRVVLDNLRKSISYILADSFTSVILVGFAKVVFGWPIPILPVQILWNNFVEDTVPDIAYAFEPKEEEVMKRGPDSPHTPLLNKEMKIMIFGTGLIDEFMTLGLFWLMWIKFGFSLDHARTMVFGAISIDTAFVIYAYKNLRKNIWNIDIFSNKVLLWSSLLVFVSYAAAVYVPFLQNILHTVPLHYSDWMILTGIGLISLLIVEVTKWFFISRHLTED